MTTLQAALNEFKGQLVFFQLRDNKSVSGKVMEAGTDLVRVHMGERLVHVPYDAIVFFEKPSSDYQANFGG